MGFGLRNTPANFQSLMNEVVRSYLQSLWLFLDDILIFSRAREEHLEHVLIVLTALRQQQPFCKQSKSLFGAIETLYLGHIISGLILAGCHVRDSAGDLAVHGALIPCVRVRACVCVRSQTPFSSRHESGPSLFLSTGKHPVGGHLPRVSFSALPGQSSDRPNLPPHQKTFDFQFPFASIRRAPSKPCRRLRKRRIDRSTSKRSSKKLQMAAITAVFLDLSLLDRALL